MDNTIKPMPPAQIRRLMETPIPKAARLQSEREERIALKALRYLVALGALR